MEQTAITDGLPRPGCELDHLSGRSQKIDFAVTLLMPIFLHVHKLIQRCWSPVRQISVPKPFPRHRSAHWSIDIDQGGCLGSRLNGGVDGSKCQNAVHDRYFEQGPQAPPQTAGLICIFIGTGYSGMVAANIAKVGDTSLPVTRLFPPLVVRSMQDHRYPSQRLRRR